MLLDKPNAAFMKLVALCKDVPVNHHFPEAFMFSDANLDRLLAEDLFYLSSVNGDLKMHVFGG